MTTNVQKVSSWLEQKWLFKIIVMQNDHTDPVVIFDL